MGIGLSGIETLCLFEGGDSRVVLVFTSVDATQVEIGQPDIRLQLNCLQQAGPCLVIIIVPIGYVAKIGIGLRALGIMLYFLFEFRSSLFVVMLFPVEVAKAKMDVWL